MTTLTLLALRDIKADLWHPPIAVPNTMVLLRNLGDQVNDPNGKEDWQKHPEDFELYEIGHYNTLNGCISSPDDMKQICVLISLKAN